MGAGVGGRVHLPVPLFPSSQYCAAQPHSSQRSPPRAPLPSLLSLLLSSLSDPPPYQPAMHSVQLDATLYPREQVVQASSCAPVIVSPPYPFWHEHAGFSPAGTAQLHVLGTNDTGRG